MSFYHPDITEESWRVLLELRRRHSFILIGGWAVWLYTKGLKSKDIDIIVDFEELSQLRKEFLLTKNPRLKKYELKQGSTDVDVYVLHYSDFGIPPHLLSAHVLSVEGFRVLAPEYLLVLKLRAAMDREVSAKGEKDRIDILSLLVSGAVKLSEFVAICRQNSLDGYVDLLERVVLRGQAEYATLGLSDLRKVKLFKEKFAKELGDAKSKFRLDK
ncbi:MAG: hypothetical protein QFX35_01160 [Candidatus Verstraetearchaeota archaeon]|nr:hypothetical protein [Candidatus Verstraetearchaeota archaeon]